MRSTSQRWPLFEFHEQPWFPDVWRKLVQRALGRSIGHLHVWGAAVDLLTTFLERSRPNSVLELASGSGELSTGVWHRLAASQGHTPDLVLSDLYPDPEAFAARRTQSPDRVRSVDRSVDALDPPHDPQRAWLMLQSLHHFSPSQVSHLLRNATQNSAGFLAIESTRRNPLHTLAVLLATPLFVWVTCTLKPFHWRHLLWGLLIPVVPLTLVVDGILSNLRSYSTQDLETLASQLDDTMHWEVGTAKVPHLPGFRMVYLMVWR